MASITSRGIGVWEVAVGGGSNRTSKRVHGTYADALAVAAALIIAVLQVLAAVTLGL